MVLVRQPTTAGFRPISKYEYIVLQLKVLSSWTTLPYHVSYKVLQIFKQKSNPASFKIWLNKTGNNIYLLAIIITHIPQCQTHSIIIQQHFTILQPINSNFYYFQICYSLQKSKQSTIIFCYLVHQFKIWMFKLKVANFDMFMLGTVNLS